jgi:hypothetical protein
MRPGTIRPWRLPTNPEIRDAVSLRKRQSGQPVESKQSGGAPPSHGFVASRSCGTGLVATIG